MDTGKIVLVTGGARSGKSSYSEELAKKLGEKILYLATAIPFDEEMVDRIKRHKESRPNQWVTHEGFKDLHKVVLSQGKDYDGILLDCITVMFTNILFNYPGFDEDNIQMDILDEIQNIITDQLKCLIEAARNMGITLIMVTNEVGSGIVPERELGRVFRDMAGRTNQIIAHECDEVHFLVSGIPIKVK